MKSHGHLVRSVALLCAMSSIVYSNSVSPEHSVMTGPGLRPDTVVLPCRYFFVELKDSNGEGLSSSPGQVFNVALTAKSDEGESFNIRHEVIDLHDGSFIVRYKVQSTLSEMVIAVTVGDRHISGSPVSIEGSVQPSWCSCPADDFDAWMTSFGCEQRPHPQIVEDLDSFDEIDVASGLKETFARFDQRHSYSYCHYAVKDNRVFRRCFGEHTGFKMFPDAILSYLSRIVRLPDSEFLFNLGDWPLVQRNRLPLVPMISWCKNNVSADVLLPTYELTEASIECMGRQVLDMLIVQKNSGVAWPDKTEKAFFRGRDSRKERLDLVRLAKQHPDRIDAGITRFFFFREQEQEIGTVNYTSLFDFFKYKYQVNIDGTVAAYRFPYLLAGGSLVFKQDSPYVEHFYGGLRAWEHYVPVRSDLGDLLEKIDWARTHDAEARAVAANGVRFARQHLMPRDVVCYHAQLVREWTRRLKSRSDVAVAEDMEEVKHPAHDPRLGQCKCQTTSDATREEL